MSALSNYTGLTEMEEVVPTENILQFIMEYPYPARAGMLISWLIRGQGNVPQKLVRWNSISVPGGTKTETDTFTDVAATTTENSITPGIVGFRLPLSDELKAAAVAGIPRGLLEEGLNALSDRVDSDVLSSSTSATSIVGTTSDTFTWSKLNDALAVYRALHAPAGAMGYALVLDDGPLKSLLDDMGSTAASMAPSLFDSQAFGPTSGFKTRLPGNVALFHSSNIATEGAGRSNVLTAIGDRFSGLGVVMNEPPNIRFTRGDDAESRAVDYYVLRAWYGTGLTHPSRITEVRTAA